MQEKFIELALKEEQLQEQLNQVRNELKTVMTELKEGTYIQDPATLTVYKIVKPKGTYTHFRDIDYVRTSIEGETKGTLSKKEAEQQGFILRG
jgi:hypothetical protein